MIRTLTAFRAAADLLGLGALVEQATELNISGVDLPQTYLVQCKVPTDSPFRSDLLDVLIMDGKVVRFKVGVNDRTSDLHAKCRVVAERIGQTEG